MRENRGLREEIENLNSTVVQEYEYRIKTFETKIDEAAKNSSN